MEKVLRRTCLCTGSESLSPQKMSSPWRRSAATWSEEPRTRIWRWRDQWGCPPRCWGSPPGRLPVERVARPGTSSRWGSTREWLTSTVHQRLSSRSRASTLSLESRLVIQTYLVQGHSVMILTMIHSNFLPCHIKYPIFSPSLSSS